MARVGNLADKDIDALWAALRPRIIGTGTGGTITSTPGPQGPAGPKGVTWKGQWTVDTDYEDGDIVYLATTGASILTYFSLADHYSTNANKPVPGGTASYWHEISPGYLIIDGSRAMTGDLNMDTHDVDNIQSAYFTGAIGEGKIDQPRVVHMAGDHVDDEAKIDGLERVVFNNEPIASSIEVLSRIELNTAVTAGTDYTAAAGKVSWDDLEDAPVAYFPSGA